MDSNACQKNEVSGRTVNIYGTIIDFKNLLETP